MEMRKRGVGVDKIVYGGDRLGIYFLETGAVSRGSKVVYDRAHSSISEIKSGMIDWDTVFEGVEWFHCWMTLNNVLWRGLFQGKQVLPVKQGLSGWVLGFAGDSSSEELKPGCLTNEFSREKLKG